ncbi:MAG TPA: hypothetical protein VFV89_10345 [Nocardioides sp.]|uniref:hypothetical protein n=1 Tax=Nocardioides sp. TaxID=35761 RepID=UPI002E370ED8|nr:hypothetical protein [Nocardioides sp.]HEX5088198.1 hypothetical protein [Nocardioides sp.]
MNSITLSPHVALELVHALEAERTRTARPPRRSRKLRSGRRRSPAPWPLVWARRVALTG